MGAKLFTKALAWEYVRGHLERIGAQAPTEAEEAGDIPHVGARPVGVPIGKVLHHLDCSSVCGLLAWTRADIQLATTTLRGGPAR